MEVNNIPQSGQNSPSAGAGAATSVATAPQNNTQVVTPTREVTTSNSGDIGRVFDQGTLIRQARDRNIISDQQDFFNFRVTRYANNLTFTDAISGEIVTANLREVVGDAGVFNTSV